MHYLHTGLKHTIIHRDVKMSNILLDEKLEAKLGDFGFSKMGPPSLSKALIRIDTIVAGTVGYMAPENFYDVGLTDKSDVYSFGVVLFELLSGRSSWDSNLEEERRNLISWVVKCKQEGTMNEIIDPYLMGKIAPECFKIYVSIASSCVREEGKDRPALRVLACEKRERIVQHCEFLRARRGKLIYSLNQYINFKTRIDRLVS